MSQIVPQDSIAPLVDLCDVDVLVVELRGGGGGGGERAHLPAAQHGERGELAPLGHEPLQLPRPPPADGAPVAPQPPQVRLQLALGARQQEEVQPVHRVVLKVLQDVPLPLVVMRLLISQTTNLVQNVFLGLGVDP